MSLALQIGRKYCAAYERLRRKFLHSKALRETPGLSLSDQWDKCERSIYIDIASSGRLIGTVRLTQGSSGAPSVSERSVLHDWTRGEVPDLPWGDRVMDVTRAVSDIEGKGLYGMLILLSSWLAEQRGSCDVLCGLVKADLTNARRVLERIGFEEVAVRKRPLSYDILAQAVPVVPVKLVLANTLSKRLAAWQHALDKLCRNQIDFPGFQRIAERYVRTANPAAA